MALKVGITGGMGSGKSTVAEAFARLGVPCFEADRAGAALYEQEDFLRDLRQLLGPSVFRPDGSADKAAVARRIFADPKAMQAVNALVHPRVLEGFDRFCNLHASEPYVMFESAILFDYGFDRQMDAVVCVYLDLDERLRRLALRDAAPREALLARIARQMPALEVMRRADYVVLNYEGNPRERQVSLIDKRLRTLALRAQTS